MAVYNKGNREKVEKLYLKYPKKMGKTRGINSALAQCKTDKDLELLEKAIDNYKEYIMREAKEPQYILYFSTFMNQWKEWLDHDIGAAINPALDLSDVGFEA